MSRKIADSEIDLFGYPMRVPDPKYPDSPGYSEPTTSKEAALSMEPLVGSLRAMVKAFIKNRGSLGATCDEAESILNLRHQTCSARFTELELGGHIVKNGERRLTRSRRRANVFIVVP